MRSIIRALADVKTKDLSTEAPSRSDESKLEALRSPPSDSPSISVTKPRKIFLRPGIIDEEEDLGSFNGDSPLLLRSGHVIIKPNTPTTPNLNRITTTTSLSQISLGPRQESR